MHRREPLPDDLCPEMSELNEIEQEFDGQEPMDPGPYETEGSIDPVSLYLKEIGQISMLTPEEEKSIFPAAARGDPAALKRLTEANLRLVVFVAKRYTGCGMDLMDLIGEGNLGLMKAVQRFDASQGFRFSTYATWWIRQAIIRGIDDKGRLIRLPAHASGAGRKLIRTRQMLEQKLGREPTCQELSDAAGISVSRIEELKRTTAAPVSLDMPICEEKDASLEDIISDGSSSDPQITSEAWQLAESLELAMADLTDKERDILALRFGLKGNAAHNLDEIGAIYHVTRERIRQILNKALKKLRYPKRSRPLIDYLQQ